MPKTQSRDKNTDIVVFEIVRDSACAECGEELGKGRWLRMEQDRPLCMSCADLAHLEYVPPGNAALTRRASKYSTLRAVLVRFSRARRRYERQGILVEENALHRAEQECLSDADAGARASQRRREREAAMDAGYRREFARHLMEQFPGCGQMEATAIAEQACLKYSGRVGRTAAANEFAPEAIDLAVRAHIRHAHTAYDHLLSLDLARQDARSKVGAEVDQIVERWRGTGGHEE